MLFDISPLGLLRRFWTMDGRRRGTPSKEWRLARRLATMAALAQVEDLPRADARAALCAALVEVEARWQS